METLKIKFKLHALEFEVEGQQEVAKDEFKNFNDNILTHLLAKVNIIQPTPILGEAITSTSSTEPVKKLPEAVTINSEQAQNNGYPILKDVKLRDLPKSESEWILIYGFYASNYGNAEFTREDILNYYKETDRKTTQRIKNLSHNFKTIVNAFFIKAVNNSNYIILPKGKEKILKILQGKSAIKEHNSKHSKVYAKNIDADKNKNDTKIKTKPVSSISFVDLKFSVKEMSSLTNFFKSKCPKGQNDEVALAINWYVENKNQDGATLEEINYLIKIATNKVPSALGQVLINMKGPKFNLLEKKASGKYSLTSFGVLNVSKLTKDSN